ncbi:MAG: polyprenol monophosphomannose synthase [Candidatus Heimdallarchaeota archaeon]
MKRCCVIVPTYNERENIKRLLSELMKVSQKAIEKWDIIVLIVDDGSPDGTASEVKRLAKENPGKIFLLERIEKKGLGDAYKAGFRHSIEELKTDTLVEMDADLSHDPSDLPRLLDKIEEGYDFVIGSRYVKGGRIEGWPWRRSSISWAGNFLGKFATGFKFKDCTSGFRAIRASMLEGLPKRLETDGYAFQLSLLYFAIQKRARIVETPIIFRERKRGESKLRNKDLMEFIKTCFKLKFGIAYKN